MITLETQQKKGQIQTLDFLYFAFIITLKTQLKKKGQTMILSI